MKDLRRLLVLPLLIALGAVTACSSEPEPPPDLAARLEKDTGTRWTVYVDPETRHVRFLAPERPVPIGAGTPEDKSRAFFARYGDALKTTGQPEELRLLATRRDRRGGVHLRFEHRIPGTELRALDVGTTAHFTADGSVSWLEVAFRADIAKVDPKPDVSKEAAIHEALEHVKSACGIVRGAPASDGVELGAQVTQPLETRLLSEWDVAATASVDVDTKALVCE